MTGLWSVLRLLFRRNWVFWLVWVLVLASLMPATISQYATLVPEGASGEVVLQGLAHNPTMRAILGPPFNLVVPGGFAFWRVGAFTAAAAGFMSGLGIIRATRAEEEEGRIELIRAQAVGRHVPLAAAVVMALGWNLVLGILVTATMASLTTPLAGALASGAAIATTGAVFVGVGAVMAQLFTSARTVRYWTLGIVLGGLYVVRAAVDSMYDPTTTSPVLQALQWANPLTWPALVRPYADERFWVLALPIALTAALVALAFRLEAVRDHGSGLRPTRPGAAEARPYLSSAWGLAWRLHRSGVIGWTIGLTVTALAIGPLAQQAATMLEGDSPYLELLHRLGGNTQDLIDAFTAAMFGIMVAIIALMAVTMLGVLRGEESAGRAELMLSTNTRRTALAGSHLVIGGGLAVLLSLASGGLLFLTAAPEGPTWTALGQGLAAAGAQLPGTLLIVGVVILLIGWAPRALPLAWVLVGWSIFTSWVGALFSFPDWLLKLQPWGHLPKLPADRFTWGAVLAETAVAVALVVLGLVGYRRRDIQGR